MLSTTTHRPRNIDTPRAAAILYGDLGTSKAYVLGIAFALAGYASFWLIAAVSLLTILVGINYMIICKYYPNGGGVYASVRKRSETVSLIGAFFLMADYLVTAALSGLSAFHYFGASDPVLFAAIGIGVIGALNFFGPRHTGTLALFMAIAAVTLLTVLAVFTIPHLKTAWHNLTPLEGSPWEIWRGFVGVIVALSGIEAVANMTGIMRLNRGSTLKKPIVTQVSSKAIGLVIGEVAIFTTLFALAAAAISDLSVSHDVVSAPGEVNVGDSMLRYLAQVFVGGALGAKVGTIFAWILSFVIGLLLLSAVNTAINGLASLQYLMANDGEFHHCFMKLNRFGVPLIALIVATIIPIGLVLLIKNVAGLATLYAIGFIGAIATNLVATSTDWKLGLKWGERGLMMVSSLILVATEITLFIDKPGARYYALAVIAVGLLLRALSPGAAKRRKQAIKAPVSKEIPREEPITPLPQSILCPINRPSKALETALKESREFNYPLHLLFLREQLVISELDLQKTWENDPDANKIKQFIEVKGKPEEVHFYYCISDSPIDIIAAYAMLLGVNKIVIDFPRRGDIVQWLRDSQIKKLKLLIPKNISISIIP